MKKGAQIVLACRNYEKATFAKSELLREVPNAEIAIISLDLSSEKPIEEFVKSFNSKFEKLDLLINNAGIMMPPYKETEDGFESQWAVNYLGHFYLTGLLMESISRSSDGRIVALSSLAHVSGNINFNDPNQKSNYKPMKSYRQSKLACLIFAYELQRRLSVSGSAVKSLAAHPGVAVTNIIAGGPKWISALAPFFGWMFHSVSAGAESILKGQR